MSSVVSAASVVGAVIRAVISHAILTPDHQITTSLNILNCHPPIMNGTVWNITVLLLSHPSVLHTESVSPSYDDNQSKSLRIVLTRH
jgi:hypothetical protein